MVTKGGIDRGWGLSAISTVSLGASTEVYEVLPILVEEALNWQADLLAQKGAALAEKDRFRTADSILSLRC